MEQLEKDKMTIPQLFWEMQRRPGIQNADIIEELLTKLTKAADDSHEILEDAVNQGCALGEYAGRVVLSSMALSAYEGAIDHLVSIGRLVRLPGRMDRYVWREQAVSGICTPAVEEDVEICRYCLELAEGPHWRECPSMALSEGKVKHDS